MAHILQLPNDSRRFLAGMHWVTHDNRPSRKKVLEIASTEGRWVAHRRGASIIQSGYAQPLDGMKSPKGLLSIAAMIAEAKPEPWLGIFDLGSGLYWYVAVRDNNGILPDGDLVGTMDEVSEARSRSSALGDWTYVDGGLNELSTLLRLATAPIRVVDGVRRPWLAPAIGATALAVVAVSGTVAWNRHEDQVERAHAQALARERAVIAAMSKKKAPVILPWTRMPSPSGMFSACSHLLGSLPVSRFGWGLSGVECMVHRQEVTAHALWKIGIGATAARAPAGILSSDGKTIVGKRMSVMVPVDRNGRAVSYQNAIRALYGVTQPLGISVSLSVPARPVQLAALPGSNPVKRDAAENPWQTVLVTMKAPPPVLSIKGLGTRLDRVPGFRLIVLSTKNRGYWVMVGHLYVSRIPAGVPGHIAPRVATGTPSPKRQGGY